MPTPSNYGLLSNNPPSTSFQSSGASLNSNQPSSLSYNSLHDPGNRLINTPPQPPPRTQQPYSSNLSAYGNSYSGPYGSTYSSPYGSSYSSPYGNSYSNPYGSSYSSPYGNSYGSGYGSYLNRPYVNNFSPYYRQNPTSPYGPSSYDASFIQAAQESSREAFSGIEGIVSTFGSINMMIESTYCALQSSFNAVLSVAENFSRLRSQFGQILSAFTIVRTLQWLLRKLLYIIGLRKMDPSTESAWREASRSVEEIESGVGGRRSSWPVIMFLIAVYAGPALMWKFITSIMQRGKAKDSWVRENGEYYYAIAKYNYKAQTPEELSFSAGDNLRLAPYEKQTDRSWPLASDGTRTGIIPINYIDIKLQSPSSVTSQIPVRKTALPSASISAGVHPSLSTSRVTMPSIPTSAVAPSVPSSTAVDPSLSTSAVAPSVPSSTAVDPSLSTSAVAPSVPSSTAVYPSLSTSPVAPSVSTVQPSLSTSGVTLPTVLTSIDTPSVQSPQTSSSAWLEDIMKETTVSSQDQTSHSLSTSYPAVHESLPKKECNTDEGSPKEMDS